MIELSELNAIWRSLKSVTEDNMEEAIPNFCRERDINPDAMREAIHHIGAEMREQGVVSDDEEQEEAITHFGAGMLYGVLIGRASVRGWRKP